MQRCVYSYLLIRGKIFQTQSGNIVANQRSKGDPIDENKKSRIIVIDDCPGNPDLMRKYEPDQNGSRQHGNRFNSGISIREF